MLIWCPHKGLISALVVLLWLLINISQICSVHTVANEGKETNELNSAKRKQCPFWNTVCRTKTLSMCMYICVCVFFPALVCVSVCWNGDGSCWIFMASVLGWDREIRRLCSGSLRGKECVCVWMGLRGGGKWARRRCVDISGLMVWI